MYKGIRLYLSILSFPLLILYSFLYSLDKPSQPKLHGEALVREDIISELSKTEKDLDILVTPEILHRFYNKGFGQVPGVKFRRNMSKKTLKKKIRVY